MADMPRSSVAAMGCPVLPPPPANQGDVEIFCFFLFLRVLKPEMRQRYKWR